MKGYCMEDFTSAEVAQKINDYEAKYDVLCKEIDELEAELTKHVETKKDLISRLQNEEKKTASVKAQYETDLNAAKKESEDKEFVLQRKYDNWRFKLYELEEKEGTYLNEKGREIQKMMQETEEELKVVREDASAKINEIERDYKEKTKEAIRLWQEYTKADKQWSKVNKRLNFLHHQFSELNRELDRLKRNKAYFENMKQ